MGLLMFVLSQVPAPRGELQLVVDKSREAVLLPIYGQLIPFHIQTIKNVTNTNDGTGNSVIRVQFNVPGAAFGQQWYPPAKKFPDVCYVQEVSYRSQVSGIVCVRVCACVCACA
jgi:nucleosome binding factor SPN SPT16 subunit